MSTRTAGYHGDMAGKKSRARNYTIPVPAWWLAAVGRIRDERTDADMLRDIEVQTGRVYSRPVLSRYCSGEITTLELTEDIWRTYRQRHKLARPFVIAQTSDDAARIERAINAAIADDIGATEKELSGRNQSQGRPIDSDREGQESHRGPTPARRHTTPGRRS